MSNLDDKLKTILQNYGAEIDPQGYEGGDHDKAIAKIKQAFADEGGTLGLSLKAAKRASGIDNDTNTEILTKAIEKAIAGGWTFNDWTDANDFEWRVGLDEFEQLTVYTESELADYEWHPWIIIFNHNFAHSLWGDDKTISVEQECNVCGSDATWWVDNCDYHLQQMVIAPDPIKYLGEHI